MKTAIKLVLLLALLTYLVFAFLRFNKEQKEVECQKVEIVIKDAERADFVSKEDILNILRDQHLNPKGQKLSRIPLNKIKNAVDGHQFVEQSRCYTLQNGDLVIEVSQRLPMLRVMPNAGEGFYVDRQGSRIPHAQYPADVIVVTGNVSYKKDQKTLKAFAQIISEDDFWNSMIEQINITSNNKIELTPRVGDHIVELGKPQDLGTKLAHLKTFYKKVLNQVGWNKYSRISLEYNNQVVCTKKETSSKPNKANT